MSFRQREVFPLPRPFDLESTSIPKPACGHLSRAVQRRLQRKRHWQQWAVDGVGALNSLAGLPAFSDSTPTLAQRSCLEQVTGAYNLVGCDPEPHVATGALSELCGASVIYQGDRSDLAPYTEESVSWPEAGSSPVPLESSLSPADKHWVHGWRSNMLRDPQSAASLRAEAGVTPYYDPAFNNTRVYSRFLQRLDQSGMLRWVMADGRKGSLGIFFVWKKGRKFMRLIFDTRVANTNFVDPPATQLPTASAFSRVEAPDGMYFAQGDPKNAFYCIEVDAGLSEYFSPKPVRAASVGVTELNGVPLSGHELLLPCLRVLPMGWNWAMHLCQCVTEEATRRAGVPLERLIADRVPSRPLVAGEAPLVAGYVDKYASFGAEAATVLR